MHNLIMQIITVVAHKTHGKADNTADPVNPPPLTPHSSCPICKSTLPSLLSNPLHISPPSTPPHLPSTLTYSQGLLSLSSSSSNCTYSNISNTGTPTCVHMYNAFIVLGWKLDTTQVHLCTCVMSFLCHFANLLHLEMLLTDVESRLQKVERTQ